MAGSRKRTARSRATVAGQLNRASRPSLSEADIQRTCTDLLIADGWRAIRTDPVSDCKRGKGFGEIGMPDYLYIRYGFNPRGTVTPQGTYQSEAQVLWIEYKRPGQWPTGSQENWGDRERKLGALCIWTDSIEKFREWYKVSGLARSVR